MYNEVTPSHPLPLSDPSSLASTDPPPSRPPLPTHTHTSPPPAMWSLGTEKPRFIGVKGCLVGEGEISSHRPTCRKWLWVPWPTAHILPSLPRRALFAVLVILSYPWFPIFSLLISSYFPLVIFSPDPLLFTISSYLPSYLYHLEYIFWASGSFDSFNFSCLSFSVCSSKDLYFPIIFPTLWVLCTPFYPCHLFIPFSLFPPLLFPIFSTFRL